MCLCRLIFSNNLLVLGQFIYMTYIAYLFILILPSHLGMQNGYKGLPSIILAGQGLLVKMFITLDPHGIF